MALAQTVDDDDMGALFRERREAQQIKRQANMLASTAKLEELGIFFVSYNAGVHLVVMDRWDFWPSTGKFIERRGRPGKPKRLGRGVFNLVKHIEEDARAASL